jgi:hypothetical protein
MVEALVLIETYQTWIYLVLGCAGLVYLALTLKWINVYRNALFGLERERAASALSRYGAMTALVVAALVGTFVTATFLGPAVPLSARPTPVPTVSLLTTPQNGVPAAQGTFVPATELALGTPEGVGCTNPLATLSEPAPDATLTGTVDIKGTANIANFAFYKFEFRSANSTDPWQAVSAGTDPVVDDLLGKWDTSLVNSGDYDFRLVVTDTSGNAPLPCVIRVHIAPSG